MSVEPLKAAGYASFQYKHDVDQRRRRQLDAAFRRPNEVLARERELIRELRVLEGQIKKVQARGVGALGAKAMAAAGGRGAAAAAAAAAVPMTDDAKPAGGAAAAESAPAAAIDFKRGPRAPPVVVASAAIFLDDLTGDSAFALDDLFPYGCGPMGALFGHRGKKGSSSATKEAPTVLPGDASAAMTDGEDASDAASLHTQETMSLPDSDAAELLAIRSLATKSRAPYRFPPGPSRAAVIADPTAGIAGAASSGNPFAGVSLRSVQLTAPVDGLSPDSRTLAKADGIIKVGLGEQQVDVAFECDGLSRPRPPCRSCCSRSAPCPARTSSSP